MKELSKGIKEGVSRDIFHVILREDWKNKEIFEVEKRLSRGHYQLIRIFRPSG